LKSGLYHATIVAQTIRNSLKGIARSILLTIDPSATSKEILSKLADMFDNIQTEDSIMQEFYNAEQTEKENTSEWALRLESLMVLACEKEEVHHSKRNTLLKQRFWKGLRSEKLKNNTRVTYESMATFEALRKKVRIEEDELKRDKGTKSVKSTETTHEVTTQNQQTRTSSSRNSASTTPKTALDHQTTTMNDMLRRMEQMQRELSNLRSDRDRETQRRDPEQTQQSRGSYSRGRNYGYGYGRRQDGYGRARGRPYYRNRYDPFDHRRQNYNDDSQQPSWNQQGQPLPHTPTQQQLRQEQDSSKPQTLQSQNTPKQASRQNPFATSHSTLN